MTIIELRNKRAQKLAAAKAYLEAKRTPDGFLSEEDDATYTKLETEITNLGNEIARMERLEALDNELSKPVNTPRSLRLPPRWIPRSVVHPMPIRRRSGTSPAIRIP